MNPKTTNRRNSMCHNDSDDGLEEHRERVREIIDEDRELLDRLGE